MNNSSTLLSVIITVHNGSQDIGACLRSIALQEGIDDYAVEIIVVDDRSEDDVAGKVRAAAIPNVSVIRIDDYTSVDLTARQVALDAGFERAKGSVIFLIDNDGIAPAQWMRKTLDLLASTGSDAVAGSLVCRSPPPVISALQIVDSAFYFTWCRIMNGLGIKTGGYFGNFAVRRDTYRSLGGFRALGFALTEDLSFIQALHDRGKKVAFLGGVPVSGMASPSWSAVLERSVRYSTGGISYLAAAFVLWVLSLPLLAVGGILWGAPFWWAALVRFLLGGWLIASSLPRKIRPLYIPALLCYEPIVISIAICVAIRVAASRHIHWGGVTYRR
ncbi:MAG: glycosyltransferase family 2 protein [Chrysiogenales bacterium]|nr:MAG: glycosyltransferase family 2 protein [Chrysiogenales bacterium]